MAMRDASRVRNLAAAAVLVVTGLGLIATSQAQLSVELPIAGGGAAQLTAETPVAVVPITVRASDEALWPSDPAISVSDAWIIIGRSGPTFSPTGGVPAQSRLTLIPHDDPQAASEAVTTGSLDLLQLCPQDRDCELQYDLVLEWLEPVAGQTFTASWHADGRVLLVGSEDLPVDASASVQVGKPDLRRIPVLSDRVADDSIHLSVDRPIAVRHVVVSASADALPVPPSIRSRAGAVLTVRTVVEGQVSPYYGEQPVIITLVADPGTPAWNTSNVVYGTVQLNPFAGCGVGEDCVHGYTLRAEWVASEPHGHR